MGTQSTSLAVHAAGLIVLYSLYGILQEKIVKGTYGPNDEHLSSSSMLVLSNRLFSCSVGIAILLFKSFKRAQAGSGVTFWQRLQPASPIWCYSAVALLNFSSTFCQYEALKYVSFTTQALAKTIKMVPVLVMSTLVYKKSHKARQWVAAGVVLLGTATYLTSRPDRPASADSSSNLWNGVFGTLLLLGYLALDGLTSTTQEKVFGRNPDPTSPFADGSPVLDQMVWVNLSASLISFVGCLLAFNDSTKTLALMLTSPALMLDVLLLSATSALGLIVLLNTIAVFGALTSSTIMTVRQFLSILINAGIFGNFGSVGLQGWLGVMYVGSGIFIKMDRRFDEKKHKPPVLPQNSPDSLNEKEGLLHEESIDDILPPPQKQQKKSYVKQYGPPLVVPVLIAFILSLALPTISPTQPDIWADVKTTIQGWIPLTAQSLEDSGEEYTAETPEEVQIEGGLWASQLHSAVAPECPSAPRETQFYPDQIPYTVLATYPRSGNTYIRGLIERATGYRTSSVYCDSTLAQTFLGECSRDRFLKKSHYPVNRVRASYDGTPTHWNQFDRGVHLIRNPIDAIWSYYNYQHSGRSHEGRVEGLETLGERQREQVRRYAERWVLHIEYWSRAPLQQHQVRYEDLRANPLPTLMNLLSFLLPSNKLPPLEDLACVVEQNEAQEAYHSRKSPAFSAWERFEPEMRDMVLQITERQWCRFGYNVLLQETLGFNPIECRNLTLNGMSS